MIRNSLCWHPPLLLPTNTFHKCLWNTPLGKGVLFSVMGGWPSYTPDTSFGWLFSSSRKEKNFAYSLLQHCFHLLFCHLFMTLGYHYSELISPIKWVLLLAWKNMAYLLRYKLSILQAYIVTLFIFNSSTGVKFF